VTGRFSSGQTRDGLGCEPVRPGLMADLDEGHYLAEIASHSSPSTGNPGAA